MLLDQSVVPRDVTWLWDYRSSEPIIDGQECKPARQYINGAWSPSADPGGIDVVNPADQSVIDRYRTEDEAVASECPPASCQNITGDQGAGSEYIAADSWATAPGRNSVIWPAAARPPSLQPPR